MLTIAALQNAETINLHTKRALSIQQQYGIDPLTIYCSATGRALGRLTDAAIATIPHNETLSDSDLITQCLLAARPSHGWILKRKKCYTHFAEVDPCGLLVHLLGLIFDKMETAKRQQTLPTHWRTSADHCAFIRNKIALFTHAQQLDDKTRSSALYHLLELDARCGLEKLTPPENITFTSLASVKQFKSAFASLLAYCDSAIEEARQVEGKAGSYFARQMTGLTPDPKKPKHTRKQSEEDAYTELLNTFLEVRDINSLDDMKDFEKSINTLNGEDATFYSKKAIQKRLDKYRETHTTSRITTGGKIKL